MKLREIKKAADLASTTANAITSSINITVEKIKSKDTTHNGYANYDTWKFCLNLGNTPENQHYIKSCKCDLLKLNKKLLIAVLITQLKHHDTYNTRNISIAGVKKFIKELE